MPPSPARPWLEPFEFALACDLRIAEDGDYLIGLLEADLGLLPGAGGTQRLPRTIGTPAALMHILMGQPLNPREAESRLFLVGICLSDIFRTREPQENYGTARFRLNGYSDR